MKFSKAQADKRGWDGLDYWVYSSKEQFPQASAVYFEVTKAHGKVKSTISDRVYYITEGEGIFEVDGQQDEVKAGDVVIIPRNTPYNYWRTGDSFKLFLVHTPAFDPAGEVRLDA
jgi:mannose-6-phosphate isomerase-like protein (cupin superfamily)